MNFALSVLPIPRCPSQLFMNLQLEIVASDSHKYIPFPFKEELYPPVMVNPSIKEFDHSKETVRPNNSPSIIVSSIPAPTMSMFL